MIASRPEGGHLPALDGLRGLAAMIVVVRHTWNAVEIPIETRHRVLETPLALVLNAQGAVQLFFVLSGFVLAGSLTRTGERAPWTSFYVRRAFRIHPPYVAGVLFAWITSPLWVAPDGVPLSDAIRRWMAVRVETGPLLTSLLFPGTAGGLLPIGWTLTVEALFSIALPVLLLCARPLRGALLIAGAFALLLLTSRGLHWYAIDFALGVVAFRERDLLMRTIAAWPVTVRAAGVLAAAWLFGSQVDLGGAANARAHPGGVAWMGLASAALVIAAISMPAFGGALSLRPCVFLGRISYSLYLLHHSVLKSVAPWALAHGGFPLLLAGVLVLSLALSSVCHRWVERPAIALGARLARRFAPHPPLALGARGVP